MNLRCIIIFFLLTAGILSCKSKKTLFESLPSSATGIDFVNQVEENDKYNVLDYMNMYTGAGVAAGDINNDGLVDIYFSGNEKSGKLFLNKGDFKFEDITGKAGMVTDRWCTGVSMVDIDQDGWLDIYICVAGSRKFGSTANLLYINQRNGTFREEAEKYGIADNRLTMNASFFDYDRDGDIDLFLITNPADDRVGSVNTITDIQKSGESAGTDILYRNNGNGTFTDVSTQAGILKEGYSLGAAISDVNMDGWPDIYVSNDFLSTDILYINNGNGTFSDKTEECLKHISYASMGNDVADVNNDGLPDIFTLDMLPEDNYRKKMIIPAAGYDRFQLTVQKGYLPQYTRNTLQVNDGAGVFSDIAFLSGVSSTDWSWSSLFADYDNDGDKDLMVTNGFYRDLGDQDYIHYQAKLKNPMGSQAAKRKDKLKAIKELANVPLNNYLFENNNDLTFTKRSEEWGFTEAGFSNGACYADLDNDGDLDLVISRFNSSSTVFRNNSNELSKNNYLLIKLTGKKPNLQALGAKVYLYIKAQQQLLELNPYRGFESSMQPVLHFGLGKETAADSIKILWPDGTILTKYKVNANATIEIVYDSNSNIPETGRQEKSLKQKSTVPLFSDISNTRGLKNRHIENDFVDFKLQPLLPHLHSKNGPGMAVGDINGDGMEDFYIGGASGNDGSFFIQDKQGKFTEKKLSKDTLYEDMGVLLFDADGDQDLDLFVVSGGSDNSEGTAMQQDRLYLNDGKGNFTLDAAALPDTRSSGSCVVACDFDKDGDLDLFVGGRVLPGSYPLSPGSYLLKNDGGGFMDVSKDQLPLQGKPGMVTAALWTDYDNDGWVDLMLAGEFMPLTFIKNEKGRLAAATPLVIDKSSGWWNSITAGDFDEDGDMDYLIGNLGLNTRFKASSGEPLCIYSKDFDKNGRLDPVMCYYVQGKNYIYQTRDEMIKQIPAMRGRFKSYKDFASVTFEESFTEEELDDAFVVKSECFESSYLQNLGNGKFERIALPLRAQFAPLYGMLAGDYTHDGHLDVLVTGNSYATEVSTGAYDALKGVLLAGDGKGNFTVVPANTTGFKVDADAKGMAQLYSANNNLLMLTAINNGPLKANEQINKEALANITNSDLYAMVQTKGGKTYKQEFYWGNGYLSNSSRRFRYDPAVVSSIFVYDNSGSKREIKINDK